MRAEESWPLLFELCRVVDGVVEAALCIVSDPLSGPNHTFRNLHRMAAFRGEGAIRKYNVNAIGTVKLRTQGLPIASKAVWVLDVKDAVLEIFCDELVDVVERFDVVIVGFAKRRNYVSPLQVDRAVYVRRAPECQPA